MTTIERGPRATDRFAIIANDALADDALSFRARGLLAYLLSRPPGWRTNADTLATQGREGREAIRTALRELEDAGYLQRTKAQGEGGRWTHTSMVRDTRTAPAEPSSDGFPGDGSPAAGEPSPVSRALSSKTETKTETKSSAATQRGAAPPDRLQGADHAQAVATVVYDETDRGVKFLAVRGVAVSVLKARPQVAPTIMADAMVALHQAGKPITHPLVCQVLDGHLTLGSSRNGAPTDRQADILRAEMARAVAADAARTTPTTHRQIGA